MSIAQAIVFSTLFAGGPAVAQESPSFAGLWERDPERSDNAEEKMQAAFEQMREEMERRGGRGGFGGGPPPGGRPAGGRGRGGGPEGIGRVPDELSVELERNEFHVDGGEKLRIYYLDGEKHKREMPNGTKLETVAERRGNAIYIEEKMERGKIDHKYELAPDGRSMIWTVTMKLGGMKEPVIIKTIYNRLES